ncbi:MAG: phosphonoacetaldehyde reductase [Eubacterium sp.]|nr:phosphonoacetaldehyde reductase [Eubacterium sp.]
MPQIFLTKDRFEEQLLQILQKYTRHRLMLVAGKSYYALPIRNVIDRVAEMLKLDIVRFSDFSPNPSYEEAALGAAQYREFRCKGILAVGGGSTIDVAKCIKLFSALKPDVPYLEQKLRETSDLLIAVPTTAGSGSESTQFAVLYRDGEKCSIDSACILPQYVILDSECLLSLPFPMKKSTFGDALSHAIESYWSLNATDVSKVLSQKAIALLLENMDDYWCNKPNACNKVMEGANLAGQAINITKTTAAHAMCYKFTSLFGVPHGHAVMLCLPDVWQYMQEHITDCRDARGEGYLVNTLNEIAHCLGRETAEDAIFFLRVLRQQLGFEVPDGITDEIIEMMAHSVNIERLNNFPIILPQSQIKNIYKRIVEVK